MAKKKKETNETGEFILNKLKFALEEHGRYTYEDKGPYEVIDVEEINEKLNTLSAQEVGKALSYVYDNHKLASDLVEVLVDSQSNRGDVFCDELNPHLPAEWRYDAPQQEGVPIMMGKTDASVIIASIRQPQVARTPEEQEEIIRRILG